MHNVVIADTSCFILLVKIKELDLLRNTYDRVFTTPEIAAEFGEKLPSWIIVQDVANKKLLHQLEAEIDLGEASAIALSYEIEDAVVILDDWGARKIANKLGIEFTGTFGVMLKAKRNNVISSVKPILEKVKQTNFRFSDEVYEQILKQADE